MNSIGHFVQMDIDESNNDINNEEPGSYNSSINDDLVIDNGNDDIRNDFDLDLHKTKN